ncbi:substrate-binding domain-containing protein [Saccharopolyspora pogona]|uniref:substrate-binding domain-containing protein n=1 Tax=Saccharopolyspora pogona TaxID=333966 RepID=UPI001683C7AC|nr:substrate-binding domain-containing protein [Saccharopolyspora pogona]
MIAVIAAGLVLAACGSDDTSQSRPQNSAEASKAARAAEAFVEPFLATPTDITVTDPLPSQPEGGKAFVWVSCDTSLCRDIAKGAEEAAEAVGWSYKNLTFKLADPASLVAALNQALDFSPAAVGFTALPEAVWSTVVPVYEKAGVQLVPAVVGPVELSETVPANIFGDESQNTQAKLLANYTIADSDGTASGLLVRVPDLITLKAFDGGVQEAYEACKTCDLSTVDVGLAQVAAGQVNGVITSELQRNPKIKYVILPSSDFAQGLPSALSTAGLNDIRILAVGSTEQDLQDVIDGRATGFVPFSAKYAGWLAVDSALRTAAGVQLPEGYGRIPMQLFVKKNTTEPFSSYEEPSDFRDQFMALWKLK